MTAETMTLDLPARRLSYGVVKGVHNGISVVEKIRILEISCLTTQ